MNHSNPFHHEAHEDHEGFSTGLMMENRRPHGVFYFGNLSLFFVAFVDVVVLQGPAI